MQSKGVSFSIDDFGTGQTSLSVLQRISVDTLKIDKCFVDTIYRCQFNSIHAHVLDSIVELARKLSLHFVAEGIEHQTQSSYLKKIGVQYLQGYFYNKPMSIEDAKQLLFSLDDDKPESQELPMFSD